MPLTTRTNGSAGSNIITASWFNDFKSLLTGGMTDQEVNITNNVMLQPPSAGPGVALSASLVAGGSLSVGIYQYVYTWVGFEGESLPSPAFTITTTTGNTSVNLASIAVGPAGTTSRKIYRTLVGGNIFHFTTTISNNTATTINDSTADSSISGNALLPGFNSFGGAYQTKDFSGTIRGQLTSDGSINLTPAPVTINGSTSGTATLYQDFRGITKRVTVVFTNYRNGAAPAQLLPLPTPFGTGMHFYAGGVGPLQFLNTGSPVTFAVITALASGGGTGTLLNTLNKYSIGDFFGGFDTISINGSQPGITGGVLFIEGI